MDARISWLRITACFLIVLLHVSGEQAVHVGPGWLIANIYNASSHVCVPIFLMISGVSLLTKSEPLLVFVRKRLIRIVPPLVFWSCVYLAWLSYNGIETSNWFLAILKGPTMYHLWYLYAVIGLYALVPVMRRFYQGATRAEKLWALSLWLAVGSAWPAVSKALSPDTCMSTFPATWIGIYQLSVFGSYAGFLLLGAMLNEFKISGRAGMIMFVAGSLLALLATCWQTARIGSVCQAFYEYTSPFIILASIGFFSMFLSTKPKAPSAFVARVADCTLGTYCLHVLIIGGIFPRMGFGAEGRDVWLTAPLMAIGGFLISMVLVYGVRLTKIGRFVS
ncbi:acyltransferase [Paraburkholderia gardini]|uniref:acyltransferase n=1 Tax=Paraburkholderia gardini TaxID=2823469 RepID=UPI001D924E34|nr:acyltransferase family protein [Paraburkholderia gardini]CAG4904831.1 O-acetyltransferase WecH [Paraburkholderia gardini]